VETASFGERKGREKSQGAKPLLVRMEKEADKKEL